MQSTAIQIYSTIKPPIFTVGGFAFIKYSADLCIRKNFHEYNSAGDDRMNPIDIEKYKKDMMRLYGKRTNIPEEVPEKTAETPEEVTEIPEEAEETQEIPEEAAEVPEETAEEQENDIEERFPEPDLSELDDEISDAEYAAAEGMGNSTGYILVNVRAGNEAFPIEDAVVLVTAVVDGNRLIIASGLTDISGTTIRLETPAPDIIYSQSPSPAKRPYSLFDISVRANGYFNARSVDVPVFSGITSIQNFNMIPVPLLMQSSDETLTYYNQEPQF